jgi:hypothetical protein
MTGMNFSDALDAWLKDTDDGEELAFRRGYVHGIAFAIDAVAAGATVDQLNDWLDRCEAWRQSFARGEQSESIAPRFKEATDGT